MKITSKAITEVVQTVENSEAGEVIVPAGEFWAHFGVQDSMQALQQQIAQRLAEEGLEVAFEVVIALPPEELPLVGEFSVPAQPAPLDLSAGTLRALSIQQPWAELILRGDKNLEYRSRRMREMGPLLVHASGTRVPENFGGRDLDPDALPYRALVGVVDVVGVQEVEGEDGLYAWQLAYPRRFRTPLPYSGAAGIFRVPTETVREALETATTPETPL
ncbi:ASCH domain-containing protein [Deinococcus sp. NW-56]|uniref:ASCH domain-containing protein n=1 Tax=Deinococcus sp. NW-56 TaxID=2080419 RepID=UPI001319C6F9|nr:ASCH domain-containing protein [Deinococcus sp. NW-56]